GRPLAAAGGASTTPRALTMTAGARRTSRSVRTPTRSFPSMTGRGRNSPKLMTPAPTCTVSVGDMVVPDVLMKSFTLITLSFRCPWSGDVATDSLRLVQAPVDAQAASPRGNPPRHVLAHAAAQHGHPEGGQHGDLPGVHVRGARKHDVEPQRLAPAEVRHQRLRVHGDDVGIDVCRRGDLRG